MHPKDSADLNNRAMAKEVAEKLKPDPRSPALDQVFAAETAGEAMSATLLGFFFDEMGSVHAGRSSSFSRLAYLIQVRWFIRAKFGFAQIASLGDARRIA